MAVKREEATVEVVFIDGADLYNLAEHGKPDDIRRPGETAVVTESHAEQLIQGGYAKRVTGE
jgi:hypothetical protein